MSFISRIFFQFYGYGEINARYLSMKWDLWGSGQILPNVKFHVCQIYFHFRSAWANTWCQTGSLWHKNLRTTYAERTVSMINLEKLFVRYKVFAQKLRRFPKRYLNFAP
jgi:hypothetical protein